MKRPRILSGAAAAVVLLALSPGGARGEAGLKFMTIPNGARETAMGETGVSHATGGGAAWWNPALTAAPGGEIELQVFRWIADTRGSFGGARFGTRWGGFGAWYFHQGVDGFEVRDRPGPPVGTFTVRQSLVAAGAAFDAGDYIRAGVVVKHYSEHIYAADASGSGVVDLGLLLTRGGWSFGAALANLELWDYVGDDLPLTPRLGVARNGDFGDIETTAAAEYTGDGSGGGFWHFGAEAGWRGVLFARGGVMTGHDTRTFSFGTGVRWERYRVDFSLTPFDEGLGDVWRMGFRLKL